MKDHTKQLEYLRTHPRKHYYPDSAKRLKDKKRMWLLEQYGNHCGDCGYSTEPLILEVHFPNHDHPRTSSGKEIALRELNWVQLKALVGYVFVLCPTCHALRELKGC